MKYFVGVGYVTAVLVDETVLTDGDDVLTEVKVVPILRLAVVDAAILEVAVVAAGVEVPGRHWSAYPSVQMSILMRQN